ncbi:MAG: respiratory chain complex I subunit 1 family protein [Caldisericaceae bacterium]
MVEKILLAVLVPLFAFLVGIFLEGFKRKMVARIQRRYGPPIIQPLLDIIKLLAKKDNISHGVMYDLGPVLALSASILTVFFIPIPGFRLLSSSADLIALLYIMVIGSLAMALGAGEAANPNASIGIARALTLMLGYDLPFVIALSTVILKFNTSNIYDIVAAQNGLNWGAFLMPITAIVAFIATYGAMGEHPFEVVVAPQEVATGPMVEYGGKHLGFLMIDHAFHIYIELALFTDLFLGGASNLLYFFLKIFGLLILLTFFDTVYPRFRIENAVRFFWRWPTVFALIGLLIVMIGG